ncbi:MAG: DUF1905 domain-containing protein [Chloroflexi bacterium]|nr:MAG: DUF1905 domain-containing protein [Chloroflexota bacterium]
MSEPVRFKTTLETARGGGAVALIPPEHVSALGGLKQMRVTGTVNGVAFHSSTMPYRGGFYLGVHKATREAAGLAFGDPLEIEMTRDESPRVLALPPELEAAFEADPELGQRFGALSFSRRRELAEPIAEARRPETRARRLEDALTRLRAR